MALTAKADIRAKAIALAALAVAPWPLCLFVPGPSPVSIAACAMASLIALVLIARLLRPIGQIAREVGAIILPDGADAAAFTVADDLQRVAQGIAHLNGRLHSMQHRWSWRHALTGLPVRETLIKTIAQDLAAPEQPGLLGAIRFADFDRLSAFDPEGAEAALQRFSERLTASLGRTRPVAHVDRDSFAIWFGNTDPAAAGVELRALCYALGAELKAGDLAVLPEVEIGTACFPADGDNPAALINRALVSFAKPGAEASGACMPGASAAMARERFSLEQDLRHAIDRGQFEMVFQPVVDLSKGVVGAEALLRWRHPEAGMISPSRFIPILEDADLIDEIGRWTLNAACREMRRWRQRGLDTLRVAVNLSAAQLRDPTLKQTIQRTLERHRLGAATLELELTETAATEDAERTHSLFGELRALGVSLAIDDFGSGYSSLSYLKNLPFDKLKVDREFVVGVHLRKDSQAICRSLVALTRGLDLQILAEGVESWDEVEFLRGLGCQIFQGFIFSRPLNSDQFVEFALDPQWRGAIRRPDPGVAPVEKRMSA